MELAYSVCLVVILSCVRLSLQCMCDWRYTAVDGEEVPNVLCYADTYVVAKILRKELVPSDRGLPLYIDGRVKFDVLISEVYRPINGIDVENQSDFHAELYAPFAGSLCGYIDFDIGETYYVSVHKAPSGKLGFNGCSFGRNVNTVTDVQKKLISGERSCPDNEDLFS